MITIIYTFILTLLFATILGLLWVFVHLSARHQMGERSGKSCEFMGQDSDYCCQQIEQCPEEIRSKCKHAVHKS